MEQIISSLTLRRMKLYHKLELENVDSVDQVECCKQSLDGTLVIEKGANIT